LVLVALLIAAQLVVGLHALEHLEEIEYDEHSDSACVQCILTSGVDACETETLAIGAQLFQTVKQSVFSYHFTSCHSLSAFTVRAPPFFPSFA
jgi:hypothetical protein